VAAVSARLIKDTGCTGEKAQGLCQHMKPKEHSDALCKPETHSSGPLAGGCCCHAASGKLLQLRLMPGNLLNQVQPCQGTRIAACLHTQTQRLSVTTKEHVKHLFEQPG
jgi:hypothetical protein